MSNEVKVEVSTTKKKTQNRLPRYAFISQFLTEKQEQTFKECFYFYMDNLEGTYSRLGDYYYDYYEYLLYTREMLDCLNSYRTDMNWKEEWKPTKEFTTLYKLLTKLDNICDRKKIGRLFFCDSR
jgi:hypothetical protein